MKLIASPLCPLCDVDQSSKHIFNDCVNVRVAKEVMPEYSSQISNNKPLHVNTNSFIKRLCYLNKDKKLNSDLFCVAIQDRINDLNCITNIRENRKI